MSKYYCVLIYTLIIFSCKEKISNEEINQVINRINNNLKIENEKLKQQIKNQNNDLSIEEEINIKSRTKIYVHNIDDFFNNLKNDVELILTMDTLNLSVPYIKSYTKTIHNYNDEYRTGKLLVNNHLILSNFENLTINSSKQTNIIVDNPEQNILTFYKSKKIELNNVKLFHLPTDFCKGEVLVCINSENIKIKNCELNGSGSIGLRLENVNNTSIENSKLFNNSINALVLHNSKDVIINQSQFYDNECLYLISMIDSDCKIKNTNFTGNDAYRFYLGEISTKNNSLYYNNCNFRDNNFEYGFNDYNLIQRNNRTLPSFYSEQGMVSLYFKAENSRDIDKILSCYANNISYYYNLEIIGDRKEELIAEYKKSWEQLMYSKNNVIEVKSEYNRSPEVINIFSFVKYKEPYTIYRIKNKVKLDLGEQGEKLHETNRDGLYEAMNKVNNIELLEKTKLESININFKKAEGFDNKEIKEVLNDYRESTYHTILNNYFNGNSFKETINLILKNREFEQEAIVMYRKNPYTSENDNEKIVDYIMTWSDITNNLSNVWNN